MWNKKEKTLWQQIRVLSEQLSTIEESLDLIIKILFSCAEFQGYDVLRFLDKDLTEIRVELVELLNRQGEAHRK